MTALLEVMTDCAVSFFKMFFGWNVVGDVSIGDISVVIFIIRVAFAILIKGSNLEIGEIPRDNRKVDISDFYVDSGYQNRIGTTGFTHHRKY